MTYAEFDTKQEILLLAVERVEFVEAKRPLHSFEQDFFEEIHCPLVAGLP